MHKLYGFINTKGEEIIEPKFKFVSNFQEGLAQVEIIQVYEQYSSLPFYTNKKAPTICRGLGSLH